MNKADEKKRLRAAGLFRRCELGMELRTPYRLADRLVAACERYARGVDPRFQGGMKP